MSISMLAGGLLLLLALSLVLSWRVDINEFSMQTLYRNRLVRCYLGASHADRKPQAFTGFDPADDLDLSAFSVNAKTPEGMREYEGPYPILNCTLNVTHGERLAWQERKGESFVFTPRFCGYKYQEQSAAKPAEPPASGSSTSATGTPPQAFSPDNSYQETDKYAYPDGGVYLGTAMATSGAAVNPNMGFHTSPPLAFLMTVFNVRLGAWMGNTQRESWQNATPLFGLYYLLAELFATTTDRSQYINLADGFHFENFGLYELIRRQCRYIIVCDAGADPDHTFSDLRNAIQKCRTDFGVIIDGLSLDALQLKEKHGKLEFSKAHAATGTIHYELIDPGRKPGKLLYIKSTLTAKDPPDLLSLKIDHPIFPHDSTADQWFDETLFEGYRSLGQLSLESALEKLGSRSLVSAMTTEDIFENTSWDY